MKPTFKENSTLTYFAILDEKNNTIIKDRLTTDYLSNETGIFCSIGE
jgi:hypothetical protein